jgi:hypothetical protein
VRQETESKEKKIGNNMISPNTNEGKICYCCHHYNKENEQISARIFQ